MTAVERTVDRIDFLYRWWWVGLLACLLVGFCAGYCVGFDMGWLVHSRESAQRF